VTHAKRDLEKLETGEKAEYIRVTAYGQQITLINYEFVHSSGHTFGCEAATLEQCRHEKRIWLLRNELEKEKRKRVEPMAAKG